MIDQQLAEIDRLEAPLRNAHAENGGLVTFQDYVRHLRNSADHPLFATATRFNQAVYEMQKNFKC